MAAQQQNPPQSAAGRPAEAAAPGKTPRQLIDDCQGIVRSLAWKIHRKLPKSVELDDLIAYGQLGLAQAARDFDASRGGQFTTYAYYRVRGAIFDGLSQMSWFSRREYHASRYEQRASEVLQLSGRTVEERAGASTEDEARWFSDVASTVSVAYLASLDEVRNAAMGETVEESSGPPACAIDREMCQKLADLINELPAEAGTLIRATYFEGLTLTDAGKRLGISKAWASRLHAKTLRRLAHGLRLMGAANE